MRRPIERIRTMVDRRRDQRTNIRIDLVGFKEEDLERLGRDLTRGNWSEISSDLGAYIIRALDEPTIG